MDFAGFLARMRSFQATDASDGDFNAFLPMALRDAELRTWRDLDPLEARRQAALPYAAGAAAATLPAEAWIVRRVVLLQPVGAAAAGAGAPGQARRVPLQQRQPGFLEAYWPNPALTGVPKYWAQQEPGSVWLAPTPAAGLFFTVDYLREPPEMGDARPRTWLGDHYPDLMCAAALAVQNAWNKNYGTGDDPQGAPYWEGQYTKLLAAARSEEARKRTAPAA